MRIYVYNQAVMFGQKKTNIQPDQVICSKRKSISIEVKTGGVLVVRAPLFASDALIQKVLQKRAGWINTTYGAYAQISPIRATQAIHSGGAFLVHGQVIPIDSDR